MVCKSIASDIVGALKDAPLSLFLVVYTYSTLLSRFGAENGITQNTKRG